MSPKLFHQFWLFVAISVLISVVDLTLDAAGEN